MEELDQLEEVVAENYLYEEISEQIDYTEMLVMIHDSVTTNQAEMRQDVYDISFVFIGIFIGYLLARGMLAQWK